MSDLTDFLLARIAEDEEGAGRLHAYDCADLDNLQFYGWREGEPTDCVCAYPARVLAECEAKRRIVDLHGGIRDCGFACRNTRCPTLGALALPYADHADYREGWKP